MKSYAKTLVMIALFIIGIATNSYAQCEIGEIEATPTECDSSAYFNMIISFDHANTGSQGFTIQGNGTVYGTWNYDDLPVIIYDLYGDGTTFYEFLVKDVEFPDCSNVLEFGTWDCSGGDCAIWNVDVFPQPCDSGYFYVTLGFWYENVGSQGFRVQGNGNNYGNFEYDDLPISIGPLEGDGVTVYEFVVIDNEFEGCSDWAAIDPVDCYGTGGDCEIGELIIDDHPCDSNNMFYVYFNFEYANVSDSGFLLYINNSIYGVYFYDELPIENLGPFEGDGVTEYHFLVRDADTWECASDGNIGPIDCGTGGECNIYDVWADVLPCNDAGYFNVLLDFEYENVGNDGFRVQGNGVNYGSFPYDSIPVMIGPLPGDGNTIYEFVVTDNQFEYCSDWTAIDPVDCNTGGDCHIWDLVVDEHPCEEGEFYVLVDFEYENVSEEGFALYVNNEFYEEYAYSELPLNEVGPFEGDGSTIYHFVVYDLVYDSCLEDASVGPIECDSISGECEIGEIDVTILPCDENDEFFVLLDFDYANTSDEFSVQGNGINWGTFLYDDVPVQVGPLNGDGNTVWEFAVIDVIYTDCAEDTYIDPVYCDSITEFMNFSTQVISCDDEMYEIRLDFDAHNTGNQGFTLHGNEQVYGSFTYDQLPLTIGPLETDGTTAYHFIARDKENPEYGNWDKLIPFTCESLGIEEPEHGETVKVYPNPSSGIINFKNLDGGTVEVKLFSSTGAEIISFTMTDTYQLNELETGIYFYLLNSGSEVLGSGKVIVTK